ncbi:MAG: flagellar biosynthesis protein FlhB [Oscillospiraceae bacterium]|nr:flagellar biosynthesis protein FlhB [Oscillospiraceae bacterium]
MGQGGGQEKTEKATPKKRKDAREKEGNVLQSKEITTAASLALIFFLFYIMGEYILQRLMTTTQESLDMVMSIGVEGSVSVETLMQIVRFIITSFVVSIGPLFAVALAIPVLSSVAQTKGLFTMKPLTPKFSKLDPIKGAKRLFSMQTVMNVVKGLIVIVAVMALVFNRIYNATGEYYNLLDMELRQSILYMGKEIFALVMLIVMIIIFVSAGDYLFQWWQYEKKLKMSKQEVKDEYKQMEGDPAIKSKIKAKQREIAGQRMMEQVPQSDVVVRNPTHFAVAISYNRQDNISAPTVTAKGKDALALRIIDIAEEHDIYVTENRPLARELYDTVEVGQEIPPSLYNAIAIILTDMYTAKGITLDDKQNNVKN